MDGCEVFSWLCSRAVTTGSYIVGGATALYSGAVSFGNGSVNEWNGDAKFWTIVMSVAIIVAVGTAVPSRI